jgi:hypothetical protein
MGSAQQPPGVTVKTLTGASVFVAVPSRRIAASAVKRHALVALGGGAEVREADMRRSKLFHRGQELDAQELELGCAEIRTLVLMGWERKAWSAAAPPKAPPLQPLIVMPASFAGSPVSAKLCHPPCQSPSQLPSQPPAQPSTRALGRSLAAELAVERQPGVVVARTTTAQGGTSSHPDVVTGVEPIAQSEAEEKRGALTQVSKKNLVSLFRCWRRQLGWWARCSELLLVWCCLISSVRPSP